jgi:CubicO group peptidase (beta-lactamase class C family)
MPDLVRISVKAITFYFPSNYSTSKSSMRLPSHILVGLACLTGAFANLLGPVYPPPRDLSSSNSLVAVSWKNLTSKLNAQLNDKDANDPSGVSALRNLTFSAGLFSTLDPKAEHLQFHHTSSEVANSPIGVKKVNGDSIYKVASVSKLFTVLAGLIELDPQDWDLPLTDIFPFLDDHVHKQQDKFRLVYDVQWDKVTLRSLAGQMSGIPHGATEDFLQTFAQYKYLEGSHDPALTDPNFYGLPPLNESNLSLWPACIGEQKVGCNPVTWDVGYSARPPVFLPWTGPEYANSGYIFLGLAISNLTGKNMNEWYSDSIFEPLGLKSTYSAPPDNSTRTRSVLSTALETQFVPDGGVTTPSGGLFSTTNDLSKLGMALLNPTLLPSEKTREWMKPVTHTSSLHYSVSAPWEIYRYVHAGSGVVTDLYTKLGYSGFYGGILVVIPEFHAGFTLLSASSQTTGSGLTLLAIDLITDSILPALMEQAAREAAQEFTGTYEAEDLESSLTLAVVPPNQPAPGLNITSWISNGTDITTKVTTLLGGVDSRLVPSIVTEQASGQVAFRGYTGSQQPNVGVGSASSLFSSFYDINDWTMLDQLTWGGIATSLFVFCVEENGEVKSVTPSAYRVKMAKKQQHM